MASSRTKRKNMWQFAILILAVAAVVVASIFFQKWWNNRPGAEPQDVAIEASSGGNKVEVSPYSVCEPGTTCEEGKPTVVKVAEGDTLKLEIPKDIYDHDWSLLKIYDDPAANDQMFFKSNEKQSVELPATIDPLTEGGERPKLVVAEISTVLIGHDDKGAETPYTVVWSISTADAE